MLLLKSIEIIYGAFFYHQAFQRVCCLFILLGANTYGSTLLVLGDSLSAGYGVNQESGWVALLADDWNDKHQIINGSISGDTTGGGLNRLPLLAGKV